MNSRIQRRLIQLSLSLACFVGPLMIGASPAMAADTDIPGDLRLEGYKKNVTLDGGPAMYYLIFSGMIVLCVGVMFMDAKRADTIK